MAYDNIPLHDIEDNIKYFLENIKPLVAEEKYQYLLENYGTMIDIDEANKKLNSIKEPNFTLETSHTNYLNNQEPLLLSTNYNLVLKPLSDDEIIVYLSKLIYAYANTINNIENIDCEFSNHQLKYYKHGYRTFSSTNDVFIDESKAIYCGFFYNNHYYTIDLINKNETASISSIYNTIISILDLNQPLITNFNQGLLLDSATSYDFTKTLDQDLLKVVNKAMFNISYAKTNSNDNQYLANGLNIIPTQTLNLALFNDSILVINSEHTNIDGISHLSLLEEVIKTFKQSTFIESNQNLTYQEIKFNLSNEQTKLAESTYLEYLDLRSKVNYATYQRQLTFSSKLKEHKISLDALVQLASLYILKEPLTIHESISVAHYNFGRTNYLRSISNEGITFINSLDEQEPNLDLLIKASKAHSFKIKQAKSFYGLLKQSDVLKTMFDYDCPLFNDEAFLNYQKQSICTSSLGHQSNLMSFNFVPPEKDGLAIGYFFDENLLNITFSYYNDNIIKLVNDQLDYFFNQINSLL